MRYFTIFLFFFPLLLQSQQLDPKYNFQPNGTIYTILEKDGTIYIGGSFNSVGPSQSRLGHVDSQGQPIDGCPATNGTVYAIVPDGSGGWFIGGQFTTIGGQSIGNLARLKPDGTLDTDFNKTVSSTVRTIVVHNGILYIGGAFNSVNSVNRTGLAAIDLSTGQLTGLDLGLNNSVNAMVPSPDGSTMYFGGLFTSAFSGGTSYIRNRIAAFNIADGSLNATWDPNVNNTVNSLVVYSDNIYAGGNFVSVNGGTVTRNRLAAFNAISGTATDFNPSVNSTLYSMALGGSTLYIAGAFTTVGVTSRYCTAGISLVDGTLTDFNPIVTATLINSIAVSGSTVAIGGNYTVVKGGLTRKHLATFDASTGDPLPWGSYFPGSVVNCVTFDGESLYIGGGFENIGYIRNNIAAFNASTGELTAWNPNLGAACSTIVAIGNTIYAGGSFITVNGGTARNRIAAFDATTGSATSWDPNANSSVTTLAASQDGNTIYVGGAFTTIGGQSRNRLAKFTTSGVGTLDTDWNPNAGSAIVYKIIAGTTTVFVGGTFSTVGGAGRDRLAELDMSTGLATAWNPVLNGTVFALVLDGNTLYVGGGFTQVNNGGTNRQSLAAYDITTGNLLNWDPSLNNAVYSLAVSPNAVYAGGTFTAVNNNTFLRNRIAAFNKTDGAVNPNFNPNANFGVYSLLPSTSQQKILFGGSFNTIGGATRLYMAVMTNPDDPALPVELTSFSAKMINGKVNLFWETKTEIDNHGFEVERCVAGTSWEKLGFVEGHGTSNSPRYYSFIDGEKPFGKTSYRLKQIDNDGTIDYSHTVEISGELPSVVTLEQNFPNPYNPETVIRYALPARGSAIADNVVLKVYSVAGTEVATLVNQKMEAGNHSVVFNAASAGLPSGVYLYRLTVTAADGRQFTQTRKMLLMK